MLGNGSQEVNREEAVQSFGSEDKIYELDMLGKGETDKVSEEESDVVWSVDEEDHSNTCFRDGFEGDVVGLNEAREEEICMHTKEETHLNAPQIVGDPGSS